MSETVVPGGEAQPSPPIRPRPGWTVVFPIAPEGIPLILTSLVVAALIAIFPSWRSLALCPLAMGLFSAFFFRDPERRIPDDSNLILSPADGRVTAVEQSDEGLKITIFLSVFNVHINRIPTAGQVREVEYRPGEFLAAFKPEAEVVNEQTRIRLETPHGPVDVIQIAGLIARRIICDAQIGDDARLGERYGLIRFGSCTVLRLPPGAVPLVKVKSRVKGGLSAVARWSTSGETQL